MSETREYGEFFGTGQLFGLIDPSIPPGIKALPGSTYGRNNNGQGEMWLKVGIEDTDWEQLKLKSEP